MRSIRWEIALELGLDDLFDPPVILAEHKVVEAADDMQITVITGALEPLHRAIGGDHFILRAMQQQQRTRGDRSYCISGVSKEVGAGCSFESSHELSGPPGKGLLIRRVLIRNLLDYLGQITLQSPSARCPVKKRRKRFMIPPVD